MPQFHQNYHQAKKEKHFHAFAKIPSESFQEIHLRGYVAQKVDKSIHKST